MIVRPRKGEKREIEKRKSETVKIHSRLPPDSDHVTNDMTQLDSTKDAKLYTRLTGQIQINSYSNNPLSHLRWSIQRRGQ